MLRKSISSVTGLISKKHLAHKGISPAGQILEILFIGVDGVVLVVSLIPSIHQCPPTHELGLREEVNKEMDHPHRGIEAPTQDGSQDIRCCCI